MKYFPGRAVPFKACHETIAFTAYAEYPTPLPPFGYAQASS